MGKVIVAALLIAAGCAHQQDEKQTKIVAPTAAAPAPATPAPAAGAAGCTRDDDCGAKQLCIRSQCIDISAGLAECTHVRVHFALNASDIPEGEKAGLDRAGRCLRGDSALHIGIEGNADERGTEEYNLALGDRRATTVAKYLERLGASSAQLKTVSYGKENPLCTEHDEDCWAKNRRAELTAERGKAKGKKGAR